VIVVAWLLLMSKYTFFWGPNSYDGRYVLALVPVLAAGLGFLLDRIGAFPAGFRAPAWWLFGALAAVSLYFGWESAATNFAPNLTGDSRWSPAELFTPRITRDTLWDGIEETFPSLRNLPLMAVLGVGLYAVSIGVGRASVRLGRRWGLDLVGAAEAPGEQAARQCKPVGRRRTAIWLGVAGALLASLVAASYAVPSEDRDPSAARQTSTGGRAAGGAERDEQRLMELEAIAGVLERYRQGTRGLPSTGGNVQTLCAYPEDAGCAVFEPGDAVVDPLGEPLLNGYWYVSDGERATVFALSETESEPDLASCAFYERGRFDERIGLCETVPPSSGGGSTPVDDPVSRPLP
jgi:hypothetical protein